MVPLPTRHFSAAHLVQRFPPDGVGDIIAWGVLAWGRLFLRAVCAFACAHLVRSSSWNWQSTNAFVLSAGVVCGPRVANSRVRRCRGHNCLGGFWLGVVCAYVRCVKTCLDHLRVNGVYRINAIAIRVVSAVDL